MSECLLYGSSPPFQLVTQIKLVSAKSESNCCYIIIVLFGLFHFVGYDDSTEFSQENSMHYISQRFPDKLASIYYILMLMPYNTNFQ